MEANEGKESTSTEDMESTDSTASIDDKLGLCLGRCCRGAPLGGGPDFCCLDSLLLLALDCSASETSGETMAEKVPDLKLMGPSSLPMVPRSAQKLDRMVLPCSLYATSRPLNCMLTCTLKPFSRNCSAFFSLVARSLVSVRGLSRTCTRGWLRHRR